jgi:hypothetical protein
MIPLNVSHYYYPTIDTHRGGEGGMKQHPPGKFSKNLLIKSKNAIKKPQ